jgi:hypothetical protein
MTALFAALKSAVEKGLSKAEPMLLCNAGKAELGVKRFEMTRKIEIERFSLTTSKQFEEVIAGVNAAIGHPNMAEFGRSTHEARSFAELQSAVEKGLSALGLMLFMQLDHGAISAQRNGRRDSEDDSLRHWQSPHHEGNGQACSGCGVLRAGYRACG